MDPSALSNDELMAIAGPPAAATIGGGGGDISTEALMAIAGPPAAESTLSQPMTPGRAFFGGIADLGGKVTLGAMDEIAAGGSSILQDIYAGAANLFGGNEQPGNYEQDLQTIRDLQSDYQKFAPTSSMLNNLGGVVLPAPSIFGAAGQAAPSLLKTTAKSAAVGAGYGGAGGFLSGEGDAASRLQNAETGALFGAGIGAAVPVVARGLSGAANYVGGKLSDAAEAVQETGLGIQYGDKSRGLRSTPKYLNEAGEVVDSAQATSVDASIEHQMKILRNRGFLDGAPNNPRELKVFLKQNENIVGKQLQDVISEANQALGTQKLPINFQNTANFFDELGKQAPSKASELIDDFQKVVNDYDSAGTFFNPATGQQISQPLGAASRINNVKTGVSNLTRMWERENDNVKVRFYRALYKDLQAAEDEAIAVATPENVGTFRELKDAYGALVSLGQTVNKAGARKALTLSNALEGGSKPIGIVAGATLPVLGPGSLTAAAVTAGGKAALNVIERMKPMTMSRLYSRMGDAATSSGGMIADAARATNPVGLFAPTYSGSGTPDQKNQTGFGPRSSSPIQPVDEFGSSTPGAMNQAASLSEPASLFATSETKSLSGSQSSPNTPKPSILDQAFDSLGDDMKLEKTATDSEQPRFEIPPELIKAVVHVESAGKKDAVSHAGAQGLMQLMPATGREWHKKLGLEGKYDPFDKEQNIKIGTAYLNYLVDMYDGDLPLALTAYNQGFGRVNRLLARNKTDSLEGIIDDLGPDGKAYARKVLARFNKLTGQVVA